MHEYPLALCTVMLLELVTPAGDPPPEGPAIRRLVQDLLAKALRGLQPNSRIAIESPGGALVCFMGDPEDALRSALLLRDLLSHRRGMPLTVRIALNIGPVRVTADTQDQVRADGHGVSLATALMVQAQANEVLVSPGYHNLVSRLNPDTLELFQYHGSAEHRPLESFSVVAPMLTAGLPEAPSVLTHPAPLRDSGPVDPEVVQDIEAELAGYIGPLAHVLTRKARGRACDGEALRAMLAPALQNPQTREFFLIGKLSQLRVRDEPEPAVDTRAEPDSDGSRPPPEPFTTRQVDIAPAELAIIAHTLQRYIGETAIQLMRREIDRYVDFREFVQAISGNIAHLEQREVFLRSLRRALPERPF